MRFYQKTSVIIDPAIGLPVTRSREIKLGLRAVIGSSGNKQACVLKATDMLRSSLFLSRGIRLFSIFHENEFSLTE